MQYKFTLIFLLFLNLPACSSSSTSSQASIDTRTCNAISYGNQNVDTQSVDGIYRTCMDEKKKLRKQQSKDEEKLAIIEFVFDLFWSIKEKG